MGLTKPSPRALRRLIPKFPSLRKAPPCCTHAWVLMSEHYLRYMGVVGIAAGGAAGEIAKVSHAFTPDALLRASNSP